MIVLDSGDKIRGDAAAATVVDYTLHGFDRTNAIWKQLADGQLPSSTGDLYTSTSVITVIQSIILVNTDSSARAVNLFLLPSGGTARRIIPKDLSLGVGFSLHTDGVTVSIYDASGLLQVKVGAGLNNVVEDTTPQLGGDLDLNGKNIDFPSVANISDVLDEDDMASDSATKLATQQSIKAYVDSEAVVLAKAIKRSYAITVENPNGSEDISIAFTEKAITITEIRAVLIGSSTPSVTWTIRHHATDRNNAGNEVVSSGTTTTSVTSGDDVTSFNDATIPADSFIWLETTAQSGTVTELHITIVFTVD